MVHLSIMNIRRLNRIGILNKWLAWSCFCPPPPRENQNNIKIFLFFPFIFISWRLLTLQYYSGFCHTLTWISHGFTCVPLPDPPSRLPLHPIPLGLPSAPVLSTVSCIQPGLVICFTLGSILVSMLFSQNIPPLPSPTESKNLFCTSVSLFLFCI